MVAKLPCHTPPPLPMLSAMRYVHPGSLSQTLDAVNAALFFRQPIPQTQVQKAGVFIAARLGLPGAYAGTFALFPNEIAGGIRLFTGEHATHASARHIAAEEACRVLLLLNPRPAATRAVLRTAEAALLRCVGPAAPRRPRPDADGHRPWLRACFGGAYCCGPCTVGFWRHLLAGGFDEQSTRLARGLACLHAMRKPDHTWRAFPFWYTLSALVEMPPSKAARAEMQFAAPRCEKAAKRSATDPYPARRAELARRLLARI
jgi:hypothetical protein